MQKRLILAASMGNCVHVGGIMHFLNLASDEGYDVAFLGPAVSVEDLMVEIKLRQPYMVTLGYRLTPENVIPLVRKLKAAVKDLPSQPIWVFGGTSPVAETVKKEDFFDKVYDGKEDIDDCISFLRNGAKEIGEEDYAGNLIDRINQKYPYPLLRHHFGLPSYEKTLEGIKEIAEEKVLDIISIGPDQNTQQYFFNSQLRNAEMDGAGGVPIANAEEFKKLKEASKTGNYPLLRCYSGTSDVFDYAKLLVETIDNAWAAIPLCWYNELDKRGDRDLETSFKEAQELIKWHGENHIPVEINEPHHWALRDAHDVIAVVMAYISAYNAKAMGVQDFIAQFMFNVPGNLSFSMDLAKAMAQKEIMAPLENEQFHIYRQVRTGLPFLSADLDVAKGQLAASTYVQMALKPHIIHVVGYSEAEFAATPQVVKESCRIVRGSIRAALNDHTDLSKDETVLARKAELLSQAKYLICFIEKQYSSYDQPLLNPAVITDCIKRGIIDAPHILKNDKYRGILETRVIDGKCVAYNSILDCEVSEQERMEMLDKSGRFDGACFKSEV